MKFSHYSKSMFKDENLFNEYYVKCELKEDDCDNEVFQTNDDEQEWIEIMSEFQIIIFFVKIFIEGLEFNSYFETQITVVFNENIISDRIYLL